ncbi:Zinc finger, FYVE-related [Phytophthora cactorum]|nr:Zinc finger, FYVE-related [Phytophthora cactorum]
MSNGVGFTVFQVPGAKTAKRPTATRLGGGPLTQHGEPYASSQHTGSASVASNGSGSSLLNQPRGQRNSGTTFAAFQPPGGLQPISSQSSGITTSLGAPYAGTSGSMGSHSSTGSNSGLAVPMGVGIGFKAGQGDEQQPRGGAGWMRTGRVIRVKDSGDSFRFPLDTEHLPTVNVSTEQFEALKAKLHSIAETHVNSPATWLDNPSLSPQYRNQSWKPHLEKKNCVIYRQKEAADASNLQRKVMLRAKLDTSLEELEYAINCATTEDQRAYMSHCYQESFLDSAVLQVHEKATNDDPFQFLGIKWLAFQSSVDSVFSCRDTLVAEFSKTMEDAKGQKVLVKVQQSVNMADCNGNERNFGFSRTSGTWVWLFRSMGPSSGKVDVSMFSEDRFDGNRNTPSWFANRVVSTLFHVAIHHATAADAKFLVRGRMITDKAWVPNNERPACSVCFKSFNLLRSRHHCRVCAEIMCGACTIELGIQSSKLPPGMLPETGSSFIVSVEKFCLKCINKARQERRSALAVKSAGIDLASEEAYEGNVPSSYASRASEVFYGQVPPARGSMSDHSADRDLNPQQNHSFASSSSSTSSLGGASGTSGEKSGISYAGWSTKVLSAINREKPADGAKEQSLVTLTSAGSSRNLDIGVPRTARQGSGDRRRHNSDASGGSTSISSQSDRSSTDIKSRKEPIAGDAVVLLEEPDEVQNITPLPTSFTKMEEQIAAQQALLRSMFIEGKKIMEQQQTYGGQSVEDKGTLALPPSSASIEYID